MNRKILVVEKEAKYFQQAVDVLSRDGHEVITAETGADAVAKALAEQPWLIVSGKELPDMPGEQTLLNLGVGQDSPGRAFGVIMLVPRTQGDGGGLSYTPPYPDAPGFYLETPFNPMELKQIARRLRMIMDGTYPDRTVR